MILTAVVLCIVGCIVVLWQPFLRVNSVVVEGPGSDVLPEFVQTKLMGTRYGVIPRNSIFFIPTADLRSEILNTYPNIEAVSLSASGLTSLSLTTLGRATAFWFRLHPYLSVPANNVNPDFQNFWNCVRKS
jgi:hypothetical protein